MSLNLFPQKFKERFLDMPLSRVSSLWQDLERELQSLEEVSGLTVYEDKKNNAIVVEAEVPGFKKEEIDININRGVLWIKAEKKEEESNKDKMFYRKSSQVRSFRFALPEQVDESQEPRASYEDGILKISFSKAKSAETKKIAIK